MELLNIIYKGRESLREALHQYEQNGDGVLVQVIGTHAQAELTRLIEADVHKELPAAGVLGFANGGINHADWQQPAPRMVISVLVSEQTGLDMAPSKSVPTPEPLTVLAKDFFFAELNKEIGRSRRYDHALSLFALDILPPSLSQDEEKAALNKLLDRIKNRLRDTEVMGRITGYRYGVMLPETRKSGAHVVARRLCEWVETLEFGADGQERFALNLGVAELRPSDRDGEHFFIRSEAALAKAWQRGINCVAVVA